MWTDLAFPGYTFFVSLFTVSLKWALRCQLLKSTIVFHTNSKSCPQLKSISMCCLKCFTVPQLLFCLLFGTLFPVTSLFSLAEMSSFIILAQWYASCPNPKWELEQGMRCLRSHCETILRQAPRSLVSLSHFPTVLHANIAVALLWGLSHSVGLTQRREKGKWLYI